MKTLIILLLATVYLASAQTLDASLVISATSSAFFNCTRGILCVKPNATCQNLTSFFDRTTCCPLCVPNVTKVLGAIKQFVQDYQTPCTETAYSALPLCTIPGTLSGLDPNTLFPKLGDGSSIIIPKGCPSCRFATIPLYLERKRNSTAPPPAPCTYSEFQACVLSRPRCGAGQVPRPTPDSCCPFPCIPTESVCKFEDVVACLQKQPDCTEGETPVSDENSCCPSCRRPRPVCTPDCDDDNACVWTRQQPTDQTVNPNPPAKRQVIDPSSISNNDPTTSVPRAICRPRRVLRVVLRNLANYVTADKEVLRVFIAAAVRRFCLQGKLQMCASGLLDAIDNLAVDDVKQATVAGSLETTVTFRIAGIPDSLSTSISSSISLNTNPLPTGTTSSIQPDALITFILRAIQNIRDEITLLSGAAPFDIARFLVPQQCRNVSKANLNCGIVPPPTCNETERVKIDPVTCCPSCIRDRVPPPPKQCTSTVSVPCIADLTLNTVEAPRISVDGCFHCKPRDDRPSTLTRCNFTKLMASVSDSPVCPEFQLNPDNVNFVRNTDATARGVVASLRCAPHCVHPLARCTLADRITCVRNQPNCSSGQLPEIADGACCATCRPPRPTCNPACNASNNEICIRDKATNGTTGKCVVGHPHTFKFVLSAAVKAQLGSDLQTVDDVREVIHHLVHSFEHNDNAATIDGFRNELLAARDNVASFDSASMTATLSLTTSTAKRSVEQSSGTTLNDSCNQAVSSGSANTCTFTPQSSPTTATTGAGSSSTSGQSTTGSQSTTSAPVTTGASSLSVAVALVMCFVASFMTVIM